MVCSWFCRVPKHCLHSHQDLLCRIVNNRPVHGGPAVKLLNSLFQAALQAWRRMGPSPKSDPDPNHNPTRAPRLHPAFLLRIACPPGLYDATLDPSKTLIEFADWGPVLAAVRAAACRIWHTYLPADLALMAAAARTNPKAGLGLHAGTGRRPQSERYEDLDHGLPAAGRAGPSFVQWLTDDRQELYAPERSASLSSPCTSNGGGGGDIGDSRQARLGECSSAPCPGSARDWAAGGAAGVDPGGDAAGGNSGNGTSHEGASKRRKLHAASAEGGLERCRRGGRSWSVSGLHFIPGPPKAAGGGGGGGGMDWCVLASDRRQALSAAAVRGSPCVSAHPALHASAGGTAAAEAARGSYADSQHGVAAGLQDRTLVPEHPRAGTARFHADPQRGTAEGLLERAHAPEQQRSGVPASASMQAQAAPLLSHRRDPGVWLSKPSNLGSNAAASGLGASAKAGAGHTCAGRNPSRNPEQAGQGSSEDALATGTLAGGSRPLLPAAAERRRSPTHAVSTHANPDPDLRLRQDSKRRRAASAPPHARKVARCTHVNPASSLRCAPGGLDLPGRSDARRGPLGMTITSSGHAAAAPVLSAGASPTGARGHRSGDRAAPATGASTGAGHGQAELGAASAHASLEEGLLGSGRGQAARARPCNTLAPDPASSLGMRQRCHGWEPHARADVAGPGSRMCSLTPPDPDPNPGLLNERPAAVVYSDAPWLVADEAAQLAGADRARSAPAPAPAAQYAALGAAHPGAPAEMAGNTAKAAAKAGMRDADLVESGVGLQTQHEGASPAQAHTLDIEALKGGASGPSGSLTKGLGVLSMAAMEHVHPAEPRVLDLEALAGGGAHGALVPPALSRSHLMSARALLQARPAPPPAK